MGDYWIGYIEYSGARVYATMGNFETVYQHIYLQYNGMQFV